MIEDAESAFKRDRASGLKFVCLDCRQAFDGAWYGDKCLGCGSGRYYPSETPDWHKALSDRAARKEAAQKHSERGTPIVPEVANPLTHRMHNGINATADEGQTPPPVAFHNRQDPDISGDVTHPLGSMDNGVAVAFSENQQSEIWESQVTNALAGNGGKPGQGYMAARVGMAVRRLTPVECERLQGFPDSFTAIPWRGKPAENCPDGPRYKALGNSMACNCMEWLGHRIQMVSEVAE